MCMSITPESRFRMFARRHVKLQFDGCQNELDIQIDTGFDITVMNESDYKLIGSPVLEASKSDIFFLNYNIRISIKIACFLSENCHIFEPEFAKLECCQTLIKKSILLF